MQSFLYRALLCEYNTLFIIEILDSFSSSQYKKMHIYINKLLSYKLEKSIKENKVNLNVNKENAREYLDSCIYFVYKHLENENSFLNEIEKYTNKRLKKHIRELSFSDEEDKINTETNDLNISNISNSLDISYNSFNEIKNIKVFSSEICGLGKSFKIKKMVRENTELYYYFPLGGKLTKKIIYEKLSFLLKRIKKALETNNINKENKIIELNYNKVAIHLDLFETHDTPLIQYFLL